MNLKYKPYNENDIIASLGPIKLTVKELRNRYSQMPDWQQYRFQHNELRLFALRELLEEELWLFKAKQVKLDTCYSIKNAIKKYKEFLIAQRHYQSETLYNHIEMTNEKLKRNFISTISKMSEEVLKKRLTELSQKTVISIDTTLLSEFGIQFHQSWQPKNLSLFNEMFASLVPDHFIVKINFQSSASKPVEGYEVDEGLIFEKRGNGFSYGWDKSTQIYTREGILFDDQRVNTWNFYSKDSERIWEIALPNDSYYVYLVAGDNDFNNYDQINSFDIEGTNVYDPDGMDHFEQFLIKANVQDGRLTIQSIEEGFQNRICFLEIFKNIIE